MNFPEIPGLRFIALLHEGNRFNTWKAVQSSLDRFVDIRIWNDASGEDAAAIEPFLEVARAVANLKHPGLVQIYDIVTESPHPYILMEHVAGATLAEMVAATGPLPPAKALRFAQQVAEALAYAWTHTGLVLRTIKPQNLRVNDQQQVKISDFSLAFLRREDRDPTALDGGMVVGTPHFIAPEQVELQASIDFRADIYALGATLYYVLTGKIPFEGLDTYAIFEGHRAGHLPHPRTIDRRLSLPTCRLLEKMMMKRPADRHQAWDEVATDCKRLQGSRTSAKIAIGNGESTIERPSAPHDIRRTPSTEATAPVASAPKRKQRPSPILWLPLGLWFLWLANQRLDNALGLPEWLAPSFARPSAPAPSGHRPAPPAPSLADPGRVPDTPAEETAAATPPDETPPAAPEATPQAESRWPEVLLQALKEGNLPAAIEVLEGDAVIHLPAPDVNALRTALKNVPSIRDLVGRGLMAHRGENIRIRYQGRERAIVPRRIIDGVLHADFMAEDGLSRPVAFNIDRLSPSEALRWIPPATTPEEHAAVGLLALRAGNIPRFEQHIEQAGALSRVLRQLTP